MIVDSWVPIIAAGSSVEVLRGLRGPHIILKVVLLKQTILEISSQRSVLETAGVPVTGDPPIFKESDWKSYVQWPISSWSTHRWISS